jgi:nucleotide-binding universal stress UspA family protein
MDRKILVAVDSSPHSRNCLRYLAALSGIIDPLYLTLFHIQPALNQFLVDDAETDEKSRRRIAAVMREKEAAAKKMLAEMRSWLIGRGFDGSRVDTRTEPKRLGLAKDIIEYAQENRYDAIAAGRRGLSGLEETFMGSLTGNLVEHSGVVPVWVIDGEVSNTRILLAVDGSESAFRAVDHVSFAVADSPNVSITLFHVVPKLGDACLIDFSAEGGKTEGFIIEGARRCLADFYPHVIDRFRASGLGEDQVQIKEGSGKLRVGRAIVEEAVKGDYGTVVIGRRGSNRAFFMGHISRYVLAKLRGRAIWLVS